MCDQIYTYICVYMWKKYIYYRQREIVSHGHSILDSKGKAEEEEEVCKDMA